MTDLEKVQKGLDLCLSGESSVCNDCPYDAECKEATGIGPSPLRRDALELLKELPDITRCKYCKYSEECIPPCDDRYCVFYDERHDGDWFCADGERRETND